MKNSEIEDKKALIKYLNKDIYGQDDAVKSLAYYVNILNSEPVCTKKIDKFTILFAGESGTGKTLMAKKCCSYLNHESLNNESNNIVFLPIVATEFSKEGFVGNSIAEFNLKIKKYKNDGKRLIIFIDEIDKLILDNNSFKKGVTDELLSLINENYVILSGAFSNKDTKEIKELIKKSSLEFFTRIHDYVIFKNVDKLIVAERLIKILSEKHPSINFESLKELTSEVTSYRDITSMFYRIDKILYDIDGEKPTKFNNELFLSSEKSKTKETLF